MDRGVSVESLARANQKGRIECACLRLRAQELRAQDDATESSERASPSKPGKARPARKASLAPPPSDQGHTAREP